jgi:hypothetical protein
LWPNSALAFGLAPDGSMLVHAHGLFPVPLLAIALAQPLLEHFPGSPCQVSLAFLHLLEKLHQLLIPCVLGIPHVLHTGLTALQGVIQDTHQIVVFILYAGCLF